MDDRGRDAVSQRFLKYPKLFDRAKGRLVALTDHSQYDSCRSVIRKQWDYWTGQRWEVCDAWSSAGSGTENGLFRFVEYVDEQLGPKPSRWHGLRRKDESKPFGPGNVEWVFLGKSGGSRVAVKAWVAHRSEQEEHEWCLCDVLGTQDWLSCIHSIADRVDSQEDINAFDRKD